MRFDISANLAAQAQKALLHNVTRLIDIADQARGVANERSLVFAKHLFDPIWFVHAQSMGLGSAAEETARL